MSLTARALLWRRGASVTLLVVATVTTTVAALAPTYARAAAEAMVSDRTVTGGYGFRVGRPMRFLGLFVTRVDDQGVTVFPPVSLTVVGVYRPRDAHDPFWFGHGYFDAHLYAGQGDGPDTI